MRYIHLWIAWLFKYDVIFIERELFDDSTYDLELKFMRIANKVVYDFDDAIFLRYPNKFQLLAKSADICIAGNNHLKNIAQQYNPRVEVLPTCVETEKYPVKDYTRHVKKIVIGWTGLSVNVPNIEIVSDALNRLAKERSYKLCIISELPDRIENLSLKQVDVEYVKWKSVTEFEDLALFDIGLMPLMSDEWSKYKCGLKIIQYMALAIPAVASPAGVNSELITHNVNGCLASTSDEWFDNLKLLVDSTAMRQELGMNARKFVVDKYSVKNNSKHLIKLLKQDA